MNIRRALVIIVIAVICVAATPTHESDANAACFYPRVRVTQYWYPNSCGPGPHPPWTICNDVLTLAGESGVDCDGYEWSWGDTNPNLYKTYYFEQCAPICE